MQMVPPTLSHADGASHPVPDYVRTELVQW